MRVIANQKGYHESISFDVNDENVVGLAPAHIGFLAQEVCL